MSDTAIQLEAVSKVKTTYQEYTNLLLAKCSTIDTDLSVKSSRTPRRSVYHTDIDTADDEVGSIEGVDDFGIDCDAHTLLTNAHQSYGVHATRMSGKTWHKLSPTAQGVWDQLDDESKALILGRPPDSKRSGTFSRGKPGQKGPSRGTSKINLRDISAHDLLANYHQYQAHLTDISNDDAEVVLSDENVAHTTDDSPSPLLAFLTSRGDNASPGDLRNVLSSTSSRAAKSKPTQQRQASFANLTYAVGKHRTTHRGALIDRGANGGIVGDDARIIAETDRVVNVQGIRDHQVTDLKIVSAGGVVDSQHGSVIAILHQYAHMGSGKSIHSSIQLEAFGLEVNDKSCKVTGGRQRIVTPDGYVHPLQIKDGLAYLSMRPFTDKEWETLPHVHWTQDKDWDPSVLDHALGDHDEEWFDAVTDITELPNKHLFDEFGNYRRRTAIVENHITEPYSDLSIAINARNVQAQEPDYIALRPHFGYTSGDVIKRTFQATTQLGRLSSATHLKWQYRSPNPALNVHRRNEPVATDTVYADTPAIDDGSTCAQLFFGTKTYVTEVYGMKTDRQFINALEDTIRFHGAMDKLVSDRAQVEIVTGRSVTGILHLANKTPIDWYSKKQGTVETATFGSEFAAARTCTEQIIDLRDTHRYMGVPIRERSYMFGDNKTVVDSSNTPHGKLHKRHTMLAYHRVREAIASGIIHFAHIPGDINPADILSKHWGFQQIWKQLQPLLFWTGDTRELFDKEARAK